jgi:hypothetical protein
MKEAFPGRTLQRYFVTPSPWAASAVLALYRACGVPLAGMLGPQLLRALVPSRVLRKSPSRIDRRSRV